MQQDSSDCYMVLHNHSQSEHIWCLIESYEELDFEPMRFPGGRGYSVRLTGCPATAGKFKSSFKFQTLWLLRTHFYSLVIVSLIYYYNIIQNIFPFCLYVPHFHLGFHNFFLFLRSVCHSIYNVQFRKIK